MQHYSPIL